MFLSHEFLFYYFMALMSLEILQNQPFLGHSGTSRTELTKTKMIRRKQNIFKKYFPEVL